MGTRVAAGFTLLTAVLGYFGVKEGVLDRMLLMYPYTALYVFLLVGLGVAGALASAQFSPAARIPLALPIAALLVLAIATGFVVPEFGGSRDMHNALAVLAVVGAGLAVAFMLFTNRTIHAGTMLLLLSTASLGFGLYGAAKIGVLSKHFASGIQVLPTVTRNEDVATVKLEVTAGGLHYRNGLRVSLFGIAADGTEALLGQSYLTADVGGALSGETEFRVSAAVEQAVVRVTTCNEVPVNVAPTSSTTIANTASTTTTLPGTSTSVAGVRVATVPNDDVLLCGSPSGTDEYARFPISAGVPVATTTTIVTPGPVLAVSLLPEAETSNVGVAVHGAGLSPYSQVNVAVSSDGQSLNIATLLSDSSGSISWTATVSAQPGASVDAAVDAGSKVGAATASAHAIAAGVADTTATATTTTAG